MTDHASAPDQFELQSISFLVSQTTDDDRMGLVRGLSDYVRSAISTADASSPSSIRGSLSGWWRALGTILETAIQSVSAQRTAELVRILPGLFLDAKAALDAVLVSNQFDFSSKDTVMIYSGLYLAYTSVVRNALDHIAVQADPLLAADLLLGIQAVLPIDNKGISNVYKRVRTVESEISNDTDMQQSPTLTSSLDLTLDDTGKSFEKFWTMMHASRRMDPEMLTDTKVWGGFSQAASATMNILVEQSGDNLESIGSITHIDPSEYLENPASFPVQLSSASFRRRAMLNILFTCSYVVNNSTNAIITAGARNLYGNVLKSFPQRLHTSIDTLLRFENHWLAWKSSAHSKEVCGPFEPSSRIERGMQPLGNPVTLQTEDSDEEDFPVGTPLVISPTSNLQTFVSDSTKPYTDHVSDLMAEYRQYVRDAILCDISDEQECERLSASDQGMEEAMARNGDRVFLWQFKRMRFLTNLESFEMKEKIQVDEESPGDVAMDETPAEQPPPVEDEYVVVPDHE